MSNDQPQNIRSESGTTITRRTAISMVVGASAGALPWVGASAAELQTTTMVQQANVIAHDPIRGEVVSFHMDLPYIDRTGLAKPYIPPTFTDRHYDSTLSPEATLWSYHC